MEPRNGSAKIDWHPHPFHIPDWIEPAFIVTVLLTSMYLTRAKDFSVRRHQVLDRAQISSTPSDSERPRAVIDVEKASDQLYSTRRPHKSRSIFGIWTLRTPNSSRFAHHLHSRLLQKFPFCVEMFYWILQLLSYRLATDMAAIYHAGSEQLWNTAQRHALAILEQETYIYGSKSKDLAGEQRWIEWRIQQWFLAGAMAGDWRGTFLTVLDRSYSLVHIPSTVCFIAFYYYMSPSFARFAIVRRTMILTTIIAFIIFTLYPCMPPRLLPAEYGFIDTVNGEDATSVWMSGDFVNRLAAMPSMHFGYAFCIGSVLIYESQLLQGLIKMCRRLYRTQDFGNAYIQLKATDEENLYASERPVLTSSSSTTNDWSAASRAVCFVFGLWYIGWVLLTIVATANHYFTDAMVAMMVVLISFTFNRVLLTLLPLEDMLLWAWRLEKPVPTTGLRRKLSGRTT